MRSSLSRALAFAGGLVWLVSEASIAQISVTLPIEYFPTHNVTLPLSIGDVTGQDVKAFLLTITYDASVFEVVNVATDGDLAEPFAVVVNTETPGQISIGGAHFEAIEGSGELLRINGRFLKEGTTDLIFNTFIFNEGEPLTAPSNGEISNTLHVASEDEALLPTVFHLSGNYPDPFNPETSIQFDLPETADVRVDIVDILGRVVMTLPARVYQAGANQRIDVNASSLASGIYVYQITAEGASKRYIESSTMTLIK